MKRRNCNDGILNAALIALGALAVVDNVVFHWLLAFHRFKQAWSGSVYVEVLLVLIGGDGHRRVRAGTPSPPSTLEQRVGDGYARPSHHHG